MKQTDLSTWKEIPSGTFWMGDDTESGFKSDREGPPCRVHVDSFLLQETPVTVAEFQEFVQETGYQTDAEHFGWSFVFELLVSEEKRKTYPRAPRVNWWLIVEGASWQFPEGPESTIENRLDHPVTHVSRNDALAYCKWKGCRLPTEAEWEYAARGGLERAMYPWGNDLEMNGVHQCNIWQGNFPVHNSQEDGFLGTAPVYTFQPNGYGLYQMAGNVWEWCLNPAKIPLEQFQTIDAKQFLIRHSKPAGNEEYAVKGGSFLCHCSYCNRYRVAARSSNTAESSASNLGFRVVMDI